MLKVKVFNELIMDQMKTMDQLLDLQSEIERCQDLEQELIKLQEEAKLDSLKNEIKLMKKELDTIHKTFEEQTDNVIRQYQKLKILTEGALT
ncbi:YgaB family protein [Heyndrickxia sporothermodurans]|uniref:YgaB family protein n=1 Tax=Heyndrickxia sporothermodurans TaxID=46224 RepID=UPI003D1F9890